MRFLAEQIFSQLPIAFFSSYVDLSQETLNPHIPEPLNPKAPKPLISLSPQPLNH